MKIDSVSRRSSVALERVLKRGLTLSRMTLDQTEEPEMGAKPGPREFQKGSAPFLKHNGKR